MVMKSLTFYDTIGYVLLDINLMQYPNTPIPRKGEYIVIPTKNRNYKVETVQHNYQTQIVAITIIEII